MRGFEPWISDGTPAGTVPLGDFLPGVANGLPFAFVLPPRCLSTAGRRFLLTACTTPGGYELWQCDGDLASLRRFAELTPGPFGSSPRGFCVAGDRVYFAAFDPAAGEELWSMPFTATGGGLAAPFGSGCPGTGGRVPAIGAAGFPIVASASFQITLANALASAPALVGLSAASAVTPFGGCSLYLATPVVTALVSTSSTGSVALPLPVPSSAGLIGASLFAQFVVADAAGGAFGALSASDALRVIVGAR